VAYFFWATLYVKLVEDIKTDTSKNSIYCISIYHMHADYNRGGTKIVKSTYKLIRAEMNKQNKTSEHISRTFV